MWILNFMPGWIFSALLLVGVGTFLATKFIKILPNKQAIQLASMAVILVSIYFIGASANNEAWELRVKELEAKVAVAETESKATNETIKEKVVYRTQVVRQRGADNIQYIDREVVKYDNTCVIPREFVEAHNRAAEPPK